MIEKLKTLAWFGQRPAFWPHAAALMTRKLKTNHDAPDLRQAARDWARSRARPVGEVLAQLGCIRPGVSLPTMSKDELEQGAERVRRAGVEMGGAGDLALLYAAVFLTRAARVLETGVAYGWSSYAIRSAQLHAGLNQSTLVSVDMPYVKLGAESSVGVVVPTAYREGWSLIREPDRNGIRKGLLMLGGAPDLVHYDSDKSWYGRAYAYPLLWNALRHGGLFISDDIQDNFFFRQFAERIDLPFHVTESQGKFVGIMKKL